MTDPDYKEYDVTNTILEDEEDEEDWEDDDSECEGHESLSGYLMGTTYYCDGTCR